MRLNDDPRSPARQFADWLKLEHIGAIQANEIIHRAQIARLAMETCPPRVSYETWLRLWIACDAEISRIDA